MAHPPAQAGDARTCVMVGTEPTSPRLNIHDRILLGKRHSRRLARDRDHDMDSDSP